MANASTEIRFIIVSKGIVVLPKVPVQVPGMRVGQKVR
jgi:hypothetical protein